MPFQRKNAKSTGRDWQQLRAGIHRRADGEVGQAHRCRLVAYNKSESYYHYRDNRMLSSHVDTELANAEGIFAC
jgi:hypothetical protein